jgi:hypothetical protein
VRFLYARDRYSLDTTVTVSAVFTPRADLKSLRRLDRRRRRVCGPSFQRLKKEDFYVIGYYSSNADPLKRRRASEIKVKRPRVQVKHRAEYFLKPKER